MIARLAAFFATQFPAVEQGPGPTGPPTNGNAWAYRNNNYDLIIKLSWSNGDPTAYTRIYHYIGFEDLYDTVNPGVSAYETLEDAQNPEEFRLRHFKNGQESTTLVIQYTP